MKVVCAFFMLARILLLSRVNSSVGIEFITDHQTQTTIDSEVFGVMPPNEQIAASITPKDIHQEAELELI